MVTFQRGALLLNAIPFQVPDLWATTSQDDNTSTNWYCNMGYCILHGCTTHLEVWTSVIRRFLISDIDGIGRPNDSFEPSGMQSSDHISMCKQARNE